MTHYLSSSPIFFTKQGIFESQFFQSRMLGSSPFSILRLRSDSPHFVMSDRDVSYPPWTIGLRRQRPPVYPDDKAPVILSNAGTRKIGMATEPPNQFGLGLTDVLEGGFVHPILDRGYSDTRS